MSINTFNDALGSLVATALHRRITDGEQDWYDFTEIVLNADAEAQMQGSTLYAMRRTTTIGDMLQGAVFAHIPLAAVIQSPEYRVMERMQELLGQTSVAMLAVQSSPQEHMPLTVNILTVYSTPATPPVTVPWYHEDDLPEDQVEGYYFDETQLPEPEPEPEPVVKPEYNHRRWPSPRAVRFAKALAADSYRKPDQMTHVEALQCLAAHARLTVDELRRMTPTDYLAKHMGPNAQLKLKPVYGSPFKRY